MSTRASLEVSAAAVAAVESMLFSGGGTLEAARIAELAEIAEHEVVKAVAHLNQLYFLQARPYEIRRFGAGYQMGLRAGYASIVRRLFGRTREVRLSMAAVEVLSLVAYRQPVGIQAIDATLGVDSSSIVRQLRRRNLIEPVEPDHGQRRPEEYRTTRRFLELFHLKNLDELPRVQELEKG